MRIEVLNENTVYRKKLFGEHGLSLLLEAEGHTILFDTGQTGLFMKNARQMKVDLQKIEAVILSHGHYDHTGGLMPLLDEIQVPVYCGPSACDRKLSYDRNKDSYEYIGIPWEREAVTQLVERDGNVQELFPGIYLLGNIPYTCEFEKVSPRFFVDRQGEMVSDQMSDEQMLVIKESDGLCVFAGCSHPGIINCLSYVQQVFPQERLKLIFAGMHLNGCSEERLNQTLHALEKLDFDKIVPVHCTGMRAIGKIKDCFGERCILAGTGDRIVL